MQHESSGRLVRIYLDQAEATQVESAYLAIVSALGKLIPKADVYSAITAVGRAHQKEVLEKLRART